MIDEKTLDWIHQTVLLNEELSIKRFDTGWTVTLTTEVGKVVATGRTLDKAFERLDDELAKGDY